MYKLLETKKEGVCIYCYVSGRLYVYEDEKHRVLEVCKSCKDIAEGKK